MAINVNGAVALLTGSEGLLGTTFAVSLLEKGAKVCTRSSHLSLLLPTRAEQNIVIWIINHKS